jgi:large subunit ribosomal protein L21
MYAIVDIAGQQVKVEKGQKILVHRLEGEKGSKVGFDKVMLIADESNTFVGNPVIVGAEVQATILDHVKGDKVFVFKKKRRKGYKKFNGHRQYLSLLEIEEIVEKGAKPDKETKKRAKKEGVETAEEASEQPVAEATAPEVEAKPEEKTEE